MISDEARYKILKILDEQPDISQRELAEQLGISLGKANYCLQQLIEKGMVKVSNFGRSDSKKKYLYLLTPEGVMNKAATASRFLRSKINEYEALRLEIEEIEKEIGPKYPNPAPIKASQD